MIDFVIPLPDPNASGWASFTDEDPPIYRWALTRNLGGGRPLVVCGLNPSTADARSNDPTVRREIGFAKLWRCGWLVKVNAYGFRATNPRVMEGHREGGFDVVGALNDAAIRAAARLCVEHDGTFLGAWGTHIEPEREAQIAAIVAEAGAVIMCLGQNADRSAKHTLYLPADAKPTPWTIRERTAT